MWCSFFLHCIIVTIFSLNIMEAALLLFVKKNMSVRVCIVLLKNIPFLLLLFDHLAIDYTLYVIEIYSIPLLKWSCDGLMFRCRKLFLDPIYVINVLNSGLAHVLHLDKFSCPRELIHFCLYQSANSTWLRGLPDALKKKKKCGHKLSVGLFWGQRFDLLRWSIGKNILISTVSY